MQARLIPVAILVLAAGALAQGPPPGRGPGRFGPGPGFENGGPGRARFLGAEAGMPGRVVKNAPYSADVVTESTQNLPDGNHIRQSSTVRVYRDSEGRTRREQSLGALGGLAANANLPQVVFINDPVAGTNYALNPSDRSATRSVWRAPGARGGRMQPGSRDAARGVRPAWSGSVGVQSGLASARFDVKTESLGRQTIEGVAADGTRTTTTIPAGQVGNEQPIQIVRERWYSQDLKTVVLSKTSDPRFGETVSRLANVSRTEPARSLFDVPADFKVSDAAARPAR